MFKYSESDFSTPTIKNKFTEYKNEYKMDLEWWSGNTTHVLPVPAVFIIKDAKIQYQHVDPNYRRRLSPEILMAYLKTLV